MRRSRSTRGNSRRPRRPFGAATRRWPRRTTASSSSTRSMPRRRPSDRKVRSGISAGTSPTRARRSAITSPAPEVNVLPLYSTEAGGSVLCQQRHLAQHRQYARPQPPAQIAEAQAAGSSPRAAAGSHIFEGPERDAGRDRRRLPGRAVQPRPYVAGRPVLRALWYQKHLNAPVRAGFAPATLSEADCQVPRGADRSWPALNREGMFRDPRAGVEFGDVVLTWYANQGEQAARQLIGATAGPYRPRRRRSRRLDR